MVPCFLSSTTRSLSAEDLLFWSGRNWHLSIQLYLIHVYFYVPCISSDYIFWAFLGFLRFYASFFDLFCNVLPLRTGDMSTFPTTSIIFPCILFFSYVHFVDWIFVGEFPIGICVDHGSVASFNFAFSTWLITRVTTLEYLGLDFLLRIAPVRFKNCFRRFRLKQRLRQLVVLSILQLDSLI